MDILLLIIGVFFIIIGIVGAFLPVIPSPITSWVGLLLLHLTEVIPLNWMFLFITLGAALLVFILDYVIPALGTKKFGGSKYGIYGTTIGLIVGLIFLGPLGIIVGPFVGTLIGELIHDSQNSKRAFKAAVGSLIGFLFSTGLKFIASVVYAGLFVLEFWKYKAGFF